MTRFLYAEWTNKTNNKFGSEMFLFIKRDGKGAPRTYESQNHFGVLQIMDNSGMLMDITLWISLRWPLCHVNNRD